MGTLRSDSSTPRPGAMRWLMRVLRFVSGCWFWLFVLAALSSLLMNSNVSTGYVSWPSRIVSAVKALGFAVPGLVAWYIANRWLAQRPIERHGFEVLPPEEKHD